MTFQHTEILSTQSYLHPLRSSIQTDECTFVMCSEILFKSSSAGKFCVGGIFGFQSMYIQYIYICIYSIWTVHKEGTHQLIAEMTDLQGSFAQFCSHEIKELVFKALKSVDEYSRCLGKSPKVSHIVVMESMRLVYHRRPDAWRLR